MSKPIAVICPIFNRLEYTKLSFPKIIHECLKNKDLIEEIFVYDDMSSDGTSEFVQSIINRYKGELKINYLRQKIGNSTFQINHTYKNTDSKYLVKIDNDIVIPTGYFNTLHWLMEKHKSIGFLMMPECADFPYIHPKEKLSINDRTHIGGVGIFRREIFVKKGDIISERGFFGFTAYQNQAKIEQGVRTCELLGSGNMNLDASPIYSRVMYYEKNGWVRNLWKGVSSILDLKKVSMKHHGYMISEELYQWILDNITKGSRILELGSGDGTKILAEHYTMFSIENNKDWLNKYDSIYIYAPIVNGWFDVEAIKRQIPKDYDFILVDAPPAFTEEARMGFYHNINLFNTNVPIIIDDTHRAGEKRLANYLKKHLGKDYEEVVCNKKSFCIFK